MTKRRLSAYCKSVVAGVLFGLPHANAQGSASIPIEHFIFIVQENDSFDNYFGTFPGANGIPAGTALADYPGGPLTNQPFLLHEETVPHDLDHGWLTAKVVWDNGAMDGFLWGEYNEGTKYYGKGIPVPTPNPALVKLQKKRTASQRQAKVNGEILSPHGFADDEDEDAPDVEEQNEALRAPMRFPRPLQIPKIGRNGLLIPSGIGIIRLFRTIGSMRASSRFVTPFSLRSRAQACRTISTLFLRNPAA